MSGEHGHPELADQGASLHADLVDMAARIATLEGSQAATDAVCASLLARVATLEEAQPPTPPVEPPAPPVEPPAPVLWACDYSNGLLDAFDSTPWNSQPSTAVPRVATLDGSKVGAYTLPAGGSRCENVASGVTFRRGETRTLSMRTRLAAVPNIGDWQVVGAQFKNDGVGSPPLALNIARGVWEFGGGWGWPGTDTPTSPKDERRQLGPAKLDVWDEWRIRVLFHDDPTVGTVDLWRNSEQLIAGWHPKGGTLYPGLSSYLKVGYYRSSAIRTASTVYLDDLTLT